MRARRLALAFALALLVAGSFAVPASAQRIIVDVAPLAAKGAGPLAARIRAQLPGEIRKALAGKYNGALTVRIRGVTLYQYTGFRIIEPTDYMEGDLIIPGRAPIPILMALPFDRSPTFLTPYGHALRINNLIVTFARWVAHYV